MRSLAEAVDRRGRVYFTGGVTAVLLNFRPSTLDIDLKFEPESDGLFRALPELKERLEVNVELASPADFIPELAGWRERSLFICQEGPLSFYHYDLYAQVLAKIERGHTQDLADVRQLLATGKVLPQELRRKLDEIEPRLYRYPAVDPPAFRRRLEEVLRS